MSLDVEVLESSFEIIRVNSVQFSEKFYINLFVDFPEVQPLFAKTNMKEQGDHLYKSLDIAVLNLRSPADLSTLLKGLGTRHVKYGILPRHYPMVGSTLLKTFEQIIGLGWTYQVRQSWVDAYSAVTSLMLEGADYSSDILTLENIENSDEIAKPEVEKKGNTQVLNSSTYSTKISNPLNAIDHSKTYQFEDKDVVEEDPQYSEKREVRETSFWTSGVFFICTIILVSALAAVISAFVSWIIFPIVLVLAFIIIGLVGGYMLKSTGVLNNPNFLNMIIETYRHIPRLIQGRSK